MTQFAKKKNALSSFNKNNSETYPMAPFAFACSRRT